MANGFVPGDNLKDDNLGLVANLSKVASMPTPTVPLIPQAEDGAGFKNRLRFAADTLHKANVQPEEIEPSFLETLGAAFRTENTVGSALASESFRDRISGDEGTPITSVTLANLVEQDGLLAHADVFRGSSTVEQYVARKNDLEREMRDRQIKEAAGWTGTGLDLVAAIADPINLIPGARVGASIAAKASRGTVAALEGALTGLGAGVATEALLQGTQVSRTAMESVANIGAATIFGGVLGFGIDAVMGREIADKVYTRFDAARNESGSTAGAKRLTLDERIEAGRKAEDTQLSSWGAFESLHKIGEYAPILRNPLLELERGLTSVERTVGRMIGTSRSVSRANAEDFVNGETIEGIKSRYSGLHADTVAVVDDLFTTNKAAFKDRADFNTELAVALSAGDRHSNEVVSKAAKEIRQRLIGPIEKELKDTSILDPNGDKLLNAESYFPLVYNADRIMAGKETFIDEHTVDFSDYLRELSERAIAASDNRKFDINSIRVKTRGVRHTAGKVDDAGNPVINPKTGKQVQETVAIEDGTVDQVLRAAKKDFENKVELVDTDIKIVTKEVADRQKKEISDVRGEVDKELAQLRKERDDMVRVDKRQTSVEEALLADPAATNKAEIRKDRRKREAEIEKSKKVVLRFEGAMDGKKKEAERIAKLGQRKDTEGKIVKVGPTHAEELKMKTEALEKQKAELKKEYDEIVEDIEADAAKQIEDVVGEKLDAEDRALLAKLTRDGKIDEDLLARTAAQRAQSMYESVTGRKSRIFDREVQNMGTVRGYAKMRSNPRYQDKLLRSGYAVSDVSEIMSRYVNSAGVDIATAKLFRKDVPLKGPDGKIVKKEVPKLNPDGSQVLDKAGEPVMVKVNETVSVPDLGLSVAKKRIADEYNSMIESAEVDGKTTANLKKKFQDDPSKLEEELGKARAKVERDLLSKRDKAIANLEMTMNFQRGVEPTFGSAKMQEMSELAGLFNYVTSMGGQVLSSLADPINIAIANGFGRSIRHGLVPMMKTAREDWLKSNGEMRRLSRLAAANTEFEMQSRMAQLGGLGQRYLNDGDTTALGKMRSLSEKFAKVAGIEHWNSGWKQVAYNTSQSRVMEAALKGFDKASKSDQTWLRTIGIGPDDLAKMRDEFTAQTGKSIGPNNMPMARWDEWGDKALGEKFRQAMYTESHNNIISPTSGDRLALQASPLGRMIFQFRSHMVTNQMRLIGRQLQFASVDREKAATVYTGLMGLAFMGAMVDFVKLQARSTGSGNDESAIEKYMQDWQDRPEQQLYNALDRSGMFGVLLEGSNIMSKLGGIGIQDAARRGRQTAQGLSAEERQAEEKASGKTAGVNTFGILFGPTVGKIQDAVGVMGTAAHGIDSMISDTEFKPKRSDFNELRRMVPFQNVPVIQQIINYGASHVGSIYDWPEPKR